MRSLIIISAVALLSASPALAQNSLSGAGAISGSSSYSGSQSAANGGSSGASINYSIDDNIPSNTTGTLNETTRQNTQAPDVVISGANACGVPMGASTSVLGFGFGFAGTPVDKGCERRDDAAAAHALGLNDVAVGIMCESPDFSSAMSATGHACPPVGQPQSQPVAYSQPVPTGDRNMTVNQEVAETPQTDQANYAAQHQAWCSTLNPGNPKDRPYIQYDCNQ
jgi:hypothetical protein